MITDKSKLVSDAVNLLKELIAVPSFSRDEAKAADVMEDFLRKNGIPFQREKNNLIAGLENISENKPTILLNAHIDTVKPAASWTKKPFSPTLEGDCLYGLGSNDCGGGLVSLLQVYRYLTQKEQPYNLVYAASAEEEVSGANGFCLVRDLLPKIDVAIVGEPTGMQPAIAEKGLMVIDGTAHGKSGHAAREEGVNAIYKALEDINWIRNYKFKKTSELLGDTKMTVTVINAGAQHNVIPDKCSFVVDVRTNEHYTNEELFHFIDKNTKSEMKVRSFRLNSSHIGEAHTLIRKCKEMGMTPFGSPTLSDQALMNFPSFKFGPGQSSRSHSADEFIKLSEIADAIDKYIYLLDGTAI